ncbi:hypothetical protein [Nocardioides houyundeii]|uniref:hypothetical protein n=1 Tax=Nocardioides houyundeii TaxID=2045452 RepID=UPI000C760792|nr:hypothetical protein [Nocardioides houyundeii]
MTAPQLDLDALAALRLRRRRDRDRLARTSAFFLDDDGTRVAVELPAPRDVAHLVSLPGVEAFRRGRALLTRPDGLNEDPLPIDLPGLAEPLRIAFRGLPDRRDALDAYRDLSRAASVPSLRFEAYLLDVLRAYREGLPNAPESRIAEAAPRPPRGPAKSNAEILSDRRAHSRADQEASTRLWLDGWLDAENPPAPGAYRLADLHTEAVKTLWRRYDSGETLPDGREIAEPGPRVFDAVLKTYLGEGRKRTNQGVTYRMTNNLSSTARAALDRTSRVSSTRCAAETAWSEPT